MGEKGPLWSERTAEHRDEPADKQVPDGGRADAPGPRAEPRLLRGPQKGSRGAGLGLAVEGASSQGWAGPGSGESLSGQERHVGGCCQEAGGARPGEGGWRGGEDSSGPAPRASQSPFEGPYRRGKVGRQEAHLPWWSWARGRCRQRARVCGGHAR